MVGIIGCEFSGANKAKTTDLPWPPSLFDEIPMSDRCKNLVNRILLKCSLEDRDYETPCWEWQGANSGGGRGGGYGRIKVDSEIAATHRVMWSCFNGFISKNRQIDHLCRNRICCNPAHLESVTNQENQRRKNIVYEEIAAGKR